MNFSEYLKNGFRMLRFERKPVKAVLADRDAKRNSFAALLLVSAVTGVLVGAFYYLMLYFVTRLEGGFPTAPPAYHFFIAAIVLFLAALAAQLLSVGITHLLARIFGSKKPLLPYFAVWMAVGFALLVISIPVAVLSFLPVLGALVSIAFSVYSVVLMMYIVRESYAISTGRAAAVVLVPLAVFFILFIIGLVFYFTAVSAA